MLLFAHSLYVFMHILTKSFRMSLALSDTALKSVASVGKRHSDIKN